MCVYLQLGKDTTGTSADVALVVKELAQLLGFAQVKADVTKGLRNLLKKALADIHWTPEVDEGDFMLNWLV